MATTRETAMAGTAMVTVMKPAQLAKIYAGKVLAHIAENGTEKRPIGIQQALIDLGCLDWTAWPATAEILREPLHPGAEAKPGKPGKDGKLRGGRAAIDRGGYAELTEKKLWAIDDPLMRWGRPWVDKIGAVNLDGEQPQIGIIEVAVSKVENDLEALTEDQREHYINLLREGAMIDGVRQGKTQALVMFTEAIMASARKANDTNRRHEAEKEFEAKTRQAEREAEQRILEKERAVDALRMKLLEGEAEREKKMNDRLLSIMEAITGRKIDLDVNDQPHGNA